MGCCLNAGEYLLVSAWGYAQVKGVCFCIGVCEYTVKEEIKVNHFVSCVSVCMQMWVKCLMCVCAVILN